MCMLFIMLFSAGLSLARRIIVNHLIRLDQSCDDAFHEFVLLYGKTYPSSHQEHQAFLIFCQNFEALKKRDPTAKHQSSHSFTSIMDKSLESLGSSVREHPHMKLPLSLRPPNHLIREAPNGSFIYPSNWTDDILDSSTRQDFGDVDAAAGPCPINTTLNAFINKCPLSNFATLTAMPPAIGKDMPNSVDFREVQLITPVEDQGQCGSCYVFGTTEMWASFMLRDRPHYVAANQKDPSLYGDWLKYTALNLSISVQFILQQGIGGLYCQGGNLASVVNGYLATGETVVPTQDCEYMMYANEDASSQPANIPKCVTPNVTLMQPTYIQLITTGTSTTYAGVSTIWNGGLKFAATMPSSLNISDYVSIDEKLVQSSFVEKVKELLARGIAVGAAMHTTGGINSKDHPLYSQSASFSTYTGGVYAEAGCYSSTTNHQVLFMGFGRVGDVPVWIIKNSWGTNWGIIGYFYVPIGRNVLCTELFFQYSLPRFWESYKSELFKPFYNATLRDELLNNMSNPYNGKIRRCGNGLDELDANGLNVCPHPGTNIGAMVILGLVFLVGIFFLRYFFRFIFCPFPRLLKPIVRVRIPTYEEIMKARKSLGGRRKDGKYAARILHKSMINARN